MTSQADGPFEPDVPTAEPVDLSPRTFSFTGSGSEYFRIWIVNLLLSIVTLGLYSAWAKVRRLRYFYGHTFVDGAAFGYHARPVAILKGRLIAYAVLGAIGLVNQVWPLAAFPLYFAVFALFPFVVVRALKFRAANTSHRGVRFAFDGSVAEAYRTYVLWPVASILSLGLTVPYMLKRQREFSVANSRYGRARFRLSIPAWPVYRVCLLALAAFFLLVGAGIAGASRLNPATLKPWAVVTALVATYILIGVLVVAFMTVFENLAWNHTGLAEHRFEGRLRASRLFGLYATNALAIGLTLGLAVPWAQVRLARYRADSLRLHPGGALVMAADESISEESATGAEFGEALDFDIGL